MTKPDEKAVKKDLDVLSLPLERSAMIGASAGTGKTFTITYLVLRLLLGDGCCKRFDLDELLVVTFTDAAASDLRERIRAKIREARMLFEAVLAGDLKTAEKAEDKLLLLCLKRLGIEKDHWQDKLFNLNALPNADLLLRDSRILLKAERSIDEASISTIHSFCNSSLNQVYSFEAGEAFDEELCSIEDLQDLYRASDHELWRSLFYKNSAEAEALLALLGISSPDDRLIMGTVRDLLKVRCSHREKGDGAVLGFSLKGSLIEEYAGHKRASVRQDLIKLARKVRDETLACNDDYTKILQNYAGSDCGSEDLEAFIIAFKDASWKRFGLKKTGQMNESVKAFTKELFSQLKSQEPDLLKLLSVAGLVAKKGYVYEDWFSFAKDLLKLLESNQAPQMQRVLSLCKESGDLILKCGQLKERSRPVALVLLGILLIDAREKACSKDTKLSFDDLLVKLDAALYQNRAFVEVLRKRYPVAVIDEFQDTDPVQFSIFKRLYLAEDHQKSFIKPRCFLIGDPKQSIYAFRNADINSYHEAESLIISDPGADPGSGCYTLNTNYRSSAGVVSSVNKIFHGFDEDHLNEDPFFDASDDGDQSGNKNRILFDEVAWPMREEPEFAGKSRFAFGDHFAEEAKCGTYIYGIALGDDTKADAVRKRQAQAAALVIKSLLQKGRLEEQGGAAARRVKPADIAVLVRSGKEFSFISEALKRFKIPCVYFSDKASVFTEEYIKSGQSHNRLTESALLIKCFMEAMLRYTDSRQILRLLLSSLNETSHDLEKLSDPKVLDDEAALLQKCRELWVKDGFVPAWSCWCERHEVIRKLLEHQNERLLTDCNQIAEIVQRKNHVLGGAEAQYAWYEKLLKGKNTGEDISSDELKHRLGSEREQVKVYTVHKSKGLEFPLVVLPFLWGALTSGNKNNNASVGTLYYDRALRHRVLALEPKLGDLDVRALNQQEELEESARLLYVALTRACAANFIISTDQNIDVQKGLPLVRELMQSAHGEDLHVMLEKAQQQDGSFKFAQIQSLEKACGSDALEQEHADEHRALVCSSLDKNIDTSFGVSSYSAVTAGLHEQFAPQPGDDDPKVPVTLPLQNELNAFNFPRGTDAGTFLHELLQELDFSRAYDPGYLESFVRRAALNHPLFSYLAMQWTQKSGALSAEDDLLAALSAWYRDIVFCPVKEAGADFCLGDLKKGQWLAEMKYLMPSSDVSTLKINSLCKSSAQEIYPDWDRLWLSQKVLSGFVTGSLDLVFEGRRDGHKAYFVADYKSTNLGGSYEDYSREAVMRSVFDPRNRYDVQYLFYSLALHRFLRNRIRDYSYERDFGGVLYLYLRGMRGADGQDHGIFYTKPKQEIIEELDKLFEHEEN